MESYVSTGVFPEGMSKDQRRRLALQSRYFQSIAGHLYRKGVDQILRRCVLESERILLYWRRHTKGSQVVTSHEYVSSEMRQDRVSEQFDNCSDTLPM